jgi:hypothetical protein
MVARVGTAGTPRRPCGGDVARHHTALVRVPLHAGCLLVALFLCIYLVFPEPCVSRGSGFFDQDCTCLSN